MTALEQIREVLRNARDVLEMQPDLVRTDTGERGDGELNELVREVYAALSLLETGMPGYMDRANVVYFTDPPKWARRLERGVWIPDPEPDK